MPYIILAVVVGLILLCAYGAMVSAKRRRQLEEETTSSLGTFRECRRLPISMKAKGEYSVSFVSRDGDLREITAKWTRGRYEFFDEQSFQRYYENSRRRRRQPPSEKVTLDDLMLCAQINKLPGNKDCEQVLIDSSKGRGQTELKEQEMQSIGGRRFAAILQCVLMQSHAADDCEAGTLELSVKNQNVLYTWHVEGEKPNRSLFISSEPKGPTKR
jgi:hypothetical protein